MLDLFTILTKGGFVLWQRNFAPLAGTPVDALIQNVLIEERAGTDYYIKDSYALKWTFANEVDLIFIVAYQKILQLAYIDELLETVKRLFTDTFADALQVDQGIHGDYSSFNPLFNKVLLQVEDKYASNRSRAPRRFEETKKYENTLMGSKANTNAGNAPSVFTNTNRSVDEDEITKNIKALKLQASPRMGGKSRKSGKGSAKTASNASPTLSDDTAGKKKKSQKQLRVWDGQIAKGEMEALDYSNSGNNTVNADEASVMAQFVDESKLGKKNKQGIYEVQDVEVEIDDEDDEDNDDEDTPVHEASTNTGGMFSFLKNITGQRELDAQTLDPVLATMKEHLINKNVASDIAEHLCQSVKTSLMGKKLGNFERVSTAVRNSMEAALKRILTPKTSLDILRDIEQSRANNRPYTITFIGVNGVGKSTNLSKVCFWLLQNNCKILIAACDTFRSGAVEQLRVHARNLRALQTSGGGIVELFERGYGKDSAGIAKDAISYATVNHFDVVLIDTAGRMQDNEPLMRALSKLVSVNNPDKIIFVGEALVGNEAVDQLTKFNQALKDFSGLQNPRHIDGMILTKFDTIDDKVGAALSMTYITGQPIYFVGTGQTYTDLKNLRVTHVVNSLLRQ
ncbi:signal recognition particle, alpha subunit, N-terminal-domain-containing protein [Radiomyces spectabilis]|uniref:signal recognition particle, alpha subunit, N-terminal-domain-containing protein n=1 Tax=Radiomyces spectabilis TaxID=64574 RepID=UPI00221EA4B5|nr:signal recognition particle, alpha subunit, N-terminal-domain-containing protein [Radiomyces spectabilis]KAI8376136.1 signal recognition particle, alpha subunit, N-terminal-domain-containing protein [Radiomyces spectabilis]